jgi:signal transduction histidine kinase
MTTRPQIGADARARGVSRDRRSSGRFGPGSLARRLAASYAVVVLADVIVFVLAVKFLSPLHQPPVPPTTAAEVADFQYRLDSSLLRALLIGSGISLAVGAVATLAITRLMLEPLTNLRASAQRLREGHYGEQIPIPRQPELADLASDLNLLAARLADVETRRARLVSDLAHELRTPLTIIEGQLVGIADGVYEFSPELLGSVREELDRLRRLTEDLSGLSRAEENAYTLIRQRTDLATLSVELGNKLRPRFAHRTIDLICATAGPADAVVDPQRVTQILSNLLVNALAATPAGGRVTSTVTQRPDQVTIEISDNGRGIAAGDLARIFDRFERVAPAQERSGDAGSGIGLTIARSLAHAHAGTLSADSPGPGRGATFTLILPIHPPTEQNPP